MRLNIGPTKPLSEAQALVGDSYPRDYGSIADHKWMMRGCRDDPILRQREEVIGELHHVLHRVEVRSLRPSRTLDVADALVNRVAHHLPRHDTVNALVQQVDRPPSDDLCNTIGVVTDRAERVHHLLLLMLRSALSGGAAMKQHPQIMSQCYLLGRSSNKGRVLKFVEEHVYWVFKVVLEPVLNPPFPFGIVWVREVTIPSRCPTWGNAIVGRLALLVPP